MRDQNELEAWAIAVEKLDCEEDGSNPVETDTWANIEKKLNSDKPKKRTGFYAIAASLVGILMLLYVGKNVQQRGNKLLPGKVNVETVSNGKNNQNDLPLPGHVSISEPEKDTSTHTVSSVNEKKSIFKGAVIKEEKTIKDSVALQQNDLVHYEIPIVNTGKDTAAATVKHDNNAMSVSQINNLVNTIETTPGVPMKPTPILRFLYLMDKIEAAKNDGNKPLKEHKLNQPSTIQN